MTEDEAVRLADRVKAMLAEQGASDEDALDVLGILVCYVVNRDAGKALRWIAMLSSTIAE